MENKVVSACSESGYFVLYSLISLSSCVDVDPSCLPAGDGQRSGCGLCALPGTCRLRWSRLGLELVGYAALLPVRLNVVRCGREGLDD